MKLMKKQMLIQILNSHGLTFEEIENSIKEYTDNIDYSVILSFRKELVDNGILIKELEYFFKNKYPKIESTTFGNGIKNYPLMFD